MRSTSIASTSSNRSTVAITLSTASSNDDRPAAQDGRPADGVDGNTGSIGGAALRRTLKPGRYVLQVRARGATRGAYRLRRVARTFTRLRISGGGTVQLGTPATLRLTLSPGESGPARVTIERHDPFGGWLFARRVRATIVDGTGSVVFVPTLGRWRARAEFLGTRDAEPSETSGYVQFRADTPLQP